MEEENPPEHDEKLITKKLKDPSIIKSKLRVHLIAFNAVLGSFFYGYSQALLNTSANKLQTYFGWTDDEKTHNQQYATSLVPIGAFISCFFFKFLIKRGRRLCMIITDLIGIVGVGLSVLSLL
jgi:MFS family permease